MQFFKKISFVIVTLSFIATSALAVDTAKYEFLKTHLSVTGPVFVTIGNITYIANEAKDEISIFVSRYENGSLSSDGIYIANKYGILTGVSKDETDQILPPSSDGQDQKKFDTLVVKIHL